VRREQEKVKVHDCDCCTSTVSAPSNNSASGCQAPANKIQNLTMNVCERSLCKCGQKRSTEGGRTHQDDSEALVAGKSPDKNVEDKSLRRRQMGESKSRPATHRTRSDVSLESPLGIVPVRPLLPKYLHSTQQARCQPTAPTPNAAVASFRLTAPAAPSAGPRRSESCPSGCC
jgi:hypothetical protein